MTVIVNEGCVSVTLGSTYLNFDNQNVVLLTTFNCKDEYETNIDVSATEIVVTSESLMLDGDVLADGVYNFKLKITQQDGTKVIESICKLVNCNMNCMMLDIFKDMENDENRLKALLFHALLAAEDCGACSCADLCTLYEATGLINCNTNVTGCGCS